MPSSGRRGGTSHQTLSRQLQLYSPHSLWSCHCSIRPMSDPWFQQCPDLSRRSFWNSYFHEGQPYLHWLWGFFENPIRHSILCDWWVRSKKAEGLQVDLTRPPPCSQVHIHRWKRCHRTWCSRNYSKSCFGRPTRLCIKKIAVSQTKLRCHRSQSSGQMCY